MFSLGSQAQSQHISKVSDANLPRRDAHFSPDRSDRNRETIHVRLHHYGDLGKRLSPEDRRRVREITIEGTLNDDDYRVLNELGKRRKMIDYNNKEVDAFISIDLRNTNYFNGKKIMDVLPDRVFSGCDRLYTVILPAKATVIGDDAFRNCSELEVVEFPEGLTTIGRSAFYGSGLTSVMLPSSVTSICNGAFENTKIETAVIGKNVKECPIAAFDSKYLKNIDVEKGNTIYSSRSGVLYSADGLTLLNYPIGRNDGYVVPDGVTSISRSAFRLHRNLPLVTLPESITELPEGAFEECNALAIVNIPSKVTVIPKDAFRGCKAITHLDLHDNITAIDDDAFRACKGMLSIKLPNNLQTIGEQAFYYCEKLTSVEIPSTVTAIGSKAFYHCDDMREMTFLSTVPPSMVKPNDNPKKLTIIVPQGSESAYSSLEAFKKFKVLAR